jgi:hypothetical protein
MTDFSKHDLIMIQRWQRMHGTNQRKQGGLTPPPDGIVKASPLNKKKKKRSGVLFPSPKYTNTSTAMDWEFSSPPGESQKLMHNVDNDTEMEAEHEIDKTGLQALPHTSEGDQILAGIPIDQNT